MLKSCIRTLPLLGLSLSMILSGCSPKQAGSETSRAICDELRTDLPTYSRRDASETLESGARFVTTFNAVCK